MKQMSFSELNESDRQLVQSAVRAMGNAYAPYSRFIVGAAVRTDKGIIYNGANLENAVYGLGICAEVSAMAAANTAEGGAGMPGVSTIAIVGGPSADPHLNTSVVTPCGRCRQVILESAQAKQVNIRVLSCSGDLETVLESTISELLPCAFGVAHLS